MQSVRRRLVRAIQEHRHFALLLAIFVLMGILYSLTTPFFEASDELWHYPMIKRLADGKGLPGRDRPRFKYLWIDAASGDRVVAREIVGHAVPRGDHVQDRSRRL